MRGCERGRKTCWTRPSPSSETSSSTPRARTTASLKGAIVSRPAGGRAGSGEFGRAREVVAPPLEDVGEVGREVGEGAAEEDEEAEDDRVCGRGERETRVSARCEREREEVGDARTKMTSHCEARGKESGLGHGNEQERREREGAHLLKHGADGEARVPDAPGLEGADLASGL